jgi:hypothetical protein
MSDISTALSLVMAIIFGIAFIVACDRNTELQSEAVKRGYAEWVCDLEGNSTFQWKGGAK